MPSVNRDLANSLAKAVSADNIAADGSIETSSVSILDSADLLVGGSLGDRAFVTDSNRYYIHNGSGWFNIALINTTPTFSSLVDSDGDSVTTTTFALPIDGTAVNITITATDPEGVPITYSAVTDSGFDSIGTVSSSGQVFTVTPFSEDSAGTASEGTITFRASDGVNVATAVRTFSLTFTVKAANFTEFLLRAQDSDGTNVSITDASSNNHTITVNGDAAATSFTPYHPKGYSVEFDGSGDDIAVTTQLVPAGAFTVQAWVYFTDTNTSAVWAQGTSGNAGRTGVGRASSGGWFAQIGGTDVGGGDYEPEAHKWYFTELQWDTATLKFWVDGFLQGSASHTGNPENTTFRVGSLGSAWSSSYDLTGYVADVKVISGSPSGSSTVPTTRLSDETNCEYLGANLPYMADASSNNRSTTVSGSTRISTKSPLDYIYTPSKGTSVYFDGTGDYLTVADDVTLQPGSSDFTYEAWIYPTSAPNTYNSIFYKRGSGSNYSGVAIAIKSSGVFSVLVASGSSTWGIIDESSASYELNTWHHIAAVRSGSNFYFYVNGVQEISTTISFSVYDMGSSQSIGAGAANGDQPFTGYIADARIVKGSAIYTAAFTPPTSPLSAVTNTQLLTCNSSMSIYDTSNSGVLKLYGNTKSSTAQVKNNTSSIYLDGSGDYITITNEDGKWVESSRPFTAEAWIRPNDISDVGIFGFTETIGTLDQTLYISSAGNLSFYDGADITANSGGGFTADTWQHVAMVRSSDNKMRVYLDGTLKNTSSSTYSPSLASNVEIGRYSSAGTNNFTGYMEDVKLTAAVKYPFFADPTVNFNDESKTDVQFLTGHASTITDGSGNNHTITTSGAVASGFGPGPGMNSISFDGSNDYVRCDTALDFGSAAGQNFTIEGWTYFNSNGGSTIECILGINAGSNINHLLFGILNSKFAVYWDDGGASDTGVAANLQTWYHWAIVYTGTRIEVYINGSHIHTITDTTTRALDTCTLLLGCEADASNAGSRGNFLDGYISNFRITSTKRYTPDFTPSTTALTG